jgi:predicted nuclease of predicted toxin-antitoxin system
LKLKIDEHLPGEGADLLRASGHDVETALQEGLGGAKDPRVLAACLRESRALVTLDTDFANIVVYPPSGAAGLVVLRPSRQSKPAVLRPIASLLVP